MGKMFFFDGVVNSSVKHALLPGLLLIQPYTSALMQIHPSVGYPSVPMGNLGCVL